ncbi:ATP-binding protein [Pelotalea chapellei]|uniref:histidine kinase n=1 Tax=Pelotalea chapellei TaxID=44671 RepID=A0ABS5UBP9_9BACT|nr:ATP-binding protein [Pelotalea chapellei]MBT1073122.1 response regulator [Pelotalea chapellei]
MIQTEMSSDNPQRDKMGQILKAAERATNLTRSLLTFSRKQELKLEQFDLNDTIKNVEIFLRRVIGEDIKLIISLKEDNFRVAADKGHIEQVLMNLAANARDVMPEGGIFSISTDVIEMDETFIKMHGYGALGRYVVISVVDTGVGMDETTRQRIFEPFFTTKETGRGTGLGLSIAYGIIQQHNGHIHVYSELGQGTTFKIYLPLMQRDAHSSDVKISLQNQVIPGGRGTILVVDDEASVNDYLKKFLTDLGYVVLLARDGQEAIDIFRAQKDEIDLVLMDVVMPNINGSEAATEIKRLSPKVKIIFTSGYPYDLINEQKLFTESSRILMKPLIPTELAVTLREILAIPN